jgi:prepilin-type processing-associated H-X9-DG protein
LFSTEFPPNTPVPDRIVFCDPGTPSIPSVCGAVDDPAIFLRSQHPGGAHIALADGSGRFVSENIDTETFRSLGSKSSGEVTGEF